MLSRVKCKNVRGFLRHSVDKLFLYLQVIQDFVADLSKHIEDVDRFVAVCVCVCDTECSMLCCNGRRSCKMKLFKVFICGSNVSVAKWQISKISTLPLYVFCLIVN